MTLRLPQFHENERLLSRAQTISGRITVWLTAIALLVWHDTSVFMLAAFSAVLLFPLQRRLLLSVAAVGTIVERFVDLEDVQLLAGVASHWLTVAGKVAIGLAGLYLAFLLAERASRWPAIIRRHPVVSVHLGIWVALALAPVPGLGALRSLPLFAWRLSYLAASASRGGVVGSRFRDHLFYLAPIYGGQATPIGKGLDFLSRHEAGDADAIARSQLAGINLLLLALVWTVLLALLDTVVYGEIVDGPAATLVSFFSGWALDVHGVDGLFLAGTEHAWYTVWTTIYLELIRETLRLAASGHVVVACLRLMGFNVFRNTYKPLLAESILDFWNRYFYYFKEVLVDFFFYPTYLRLRKLGNAARMFAAVFAAAFAGNMYFHILANTPQQVVGLDFAALWSSWSPRLVYCFLLAFGIWVSMLRQPAIRASGEKPATWTRLRRIAGVWTFFSIIQLWNIRLDGIGIGDCTAMFLSLFGI